MKELSLHILDLVENSIKAKASLIKIVVIENIKKDILSIAIEDDGSGMDEEFLKKVEDPFVTTRTTRPVGLGISLMKAAALRCEGTFDISSEKGRGTEIYCSFKHSHIDRAPLGNMGETIMTIINQSDNSEIFYKHIYNNQEFILDTREMKGILEGVSIKSPDVLLWVVDHVNENIKDLHSIK